MHTPAPCEEWPGELEESPEGSLDGWTNLVYHVIRLLLVVLLVKLVVVVVVGDVDAGRDEALHRGRAALDSTWRRIR